MLRTRLFATTLVIGALGVVGTACQSNDSAGSSGSSSSDTSSSSSAASASASPKTKLGPLAHADDVHIDACTVDDTINAPVAHLTVTNNSSKPSDYLITIAFEAPDGSQIDTGNAFVQSLQPHQSTKEDAPSLKMGANTTGMTCKIVEADRTSAVG